MKDIQKFLNILIGADELSHQLQLELRQMVADMKVMVENLQLIKDAGQSITEVIAETALENSNANKYKPLWEE